MALIGAIIGDIIGSQYEFPTWRPEDLDYENCPLFADECEFTDDTVLSIATKYALDNPARHSSFINTYRKFYKKYPDKGYGNMFERWAKSNNLKPYGSYGNGSAMRVSYIGDMCESYKILYDIAELSASCTHDHPSGVKGAVITAEVIRMARMKCTKQDIYQYVHEQYKDNIYDCTESIEWLRDNYKWNETCDGTVPVAIRCFLESTNYESCIRNCLSLPCDMDTMCCIAGGIAEAYYGTTGLDNKKILKKYLDDYLYSCIEDML